MPDATRFPEDLIALQRATDAAFAALGEWEGEEPLNAPPSQWSPHRRAEWERRWEAYRQAGRALHGHPVIRRAISERVYGETRLALRRAARWSAGS